jgi:diguanylate cyclase (GGDEF)-like protein
MTLLLLAATTALFATVAINGERIIQVEIQARARALFRAIVLTRAWNAMHGGVMVEKTAAVPPSAFTLRADVVAPDGRVYTEINPARMTREISELAERDGLFQFHITSLQPINARNAPDPFEVRALRAFEAGRADFEDKEGRGDSTFYRYMAPLRVEASCMACHAQQGYRVGQVRGGISVSFRIDPAERSMTRNRWFLLALYAFTAGLLVWVTRRMVQVLRRKLDAAQAVVRRMAVTDPLTGLRNRRYLVRRIRDEVARAVRYGRPFSCAMFDLDHFKRVNDHWGHEAGDAVLMAVSAVAARHCRLHDVLGRWGGEEFLLLLPETGAEGACQLAERLRRAVAETRFEHLAGAPSFTASFGVATFGGTSGSAAEIEHELLDRADQALYRAKEAGRNRVVAAPMVDAGLGPFPRQAHADQRTSSS